LVDGTLSGTVDFPEQSCIVLIVHCWLLNQSGVAATPWPGSVVMSFTFEALKAVDASALTAYFDIVVFAKKKCTKQRIQGGHRRRVPCARMNSCCGFQPKARKRV
jgi:hypothetical protein